MEYGYANVNATTADIK